MTGDLRARIAAALAAHQRDEGEPSGYCECGAIVFSGEMDGHQADAVIRELGMEVEDGECGHCHAQLPGCRYVTDWTEQ